MVSLLQIIGYIGIVYGAFLALLWKYKSDLKEMQVLMSCMAMGMVTGMVSGLLLGFWLKGDPYASTFLSLLVGGGAGFLLGVPVSLLCVVEGVLSGGMAGMMGAMIGEMVPAEKAELLVLLFLLLHTTIALLLGKEIGGQVIRLQNRRWYTFLFRPLVSGALLVLVFVWFQSLGPLFSPSSAEWNEQKEGHRHDRNP